MRNEGKTSEKFSEYMSRSNYAIIDIETTGGDFKRDRVIEVAIIIHDGESELTRFDSLINPDMSIPPYISKLTGIQNEMVSTAPYFFEIAREIVELTENCIFVAHNVRFDFNFIRVEFERLGFSYSRSRLCSLKLARNALELNSYGMDSLIKHFNIEVENRHRAMGDAQALAEIFPILLSNSLEQGNSDNIHSMLSNQAIRTKFPGPKIEEIYHELPQDTGVYYFYNSNNNVIYIGKSKNIRLRIYQHFSANDDKSLRLYSDVSDIQYMITESELVAELIEASEIKRLHPSINKAQRKNKKAYYSYISTNSDSYHCLRIANIDNEIGKITIVRYHQSLTAAKAYIRTKTKELNLCSCIQENSSRPLPACLQMQMNICDISWMTDSNKFNAHFDELISPSRPYPYRNFVLIEPHPQSDMNYAVVIKGFVYMGYVEISREDNFSSIEDFLNVPSFQNEEETIDILKIIKAYIKKRKKKIKLLKFRS